MAVQINESNIIDAEKTIWQPVIRVNGIAFPVGGGGGSSNGGSMDFYKCSAVYGPKKVDCITISGCPTSAVNGAYLTTEFTTEDGGGTTYPVYSNGAYYYYYNPTDSIWCISTDYTSYNWLYYGEGTYWSDNNWDGVSGMSSVKGETTVDLDAPKTWDGYKAVLSDGIYDFEKESTAGLTYGTSYVPVVGGIYSADALVKVSGLFDNIVNNFPGSASLFAIDASVGINDLVQGGAPTLVGSGEVLQNGEFCFDSTRALDYTIGDTMSALKDFTIEMDYTVTSDQTGYCGLVGNKSSWSTMCICIQWGRSGYRPAMFWNDYFDTQTGGNEHPEWVNDGKYHHVAYVRKGDTCMLFSDGEKIAEYSGATKDLNLAIEHLLAVGTQHVENQIFPGRMKHFRVLGEALYDGKFDIPEWVGKSSDSGSGGEPGGDDEPTNKPTITVNIADANLTTSQLVNYEAQHNGAAYPFPFTATATNGETPRITSIYDGNMELLDGTFFELDGNNIMFTSGIIGGSSCKITFSCAGCDDLVVDWAYSVVFDVTCTVPSSASVTATVGEPFEWTVPITSNTDRSFFQVGVESSVPDGCDVANGKFYGTPTSAGSGTMTLSVQPVYYPTSTLQERYYIEVNYVFTSGDSGSNDGKTYLYTVSGAGTAAANGDYWDTGETTKDPFGDDLGLHIYTNGIAKLEYMTDYSQWSISIDGSQKYSINWSDDTMSSATTSTVFGDSPAPTIALYAGGGSDDGSSTNKTYVYTSEEFPDAKANGNWWDSGKREPAWMGEDGEVETIVYTNDNNYEIFWSDDGRWNMRDASGNPIYAAWNVGYEDILSGDWTLFDTSEPITGKFIAYAGGGDGSDNDPTDDVKSYAYNVSGFGTVEGKDYSIANGNYYVTGRTSAGQPVYYNGKRYLIYGEAGDMRWSFCDENDPPTIEIFAGETTSDVTAVTMWYSGAGAIEHSGVTVERYEVNHG